LVEVILLGNLPFLVELNRSVYAIVFILITGVMGFVAQIGFGDSCFESNVIADRHEQLDTNDLQDQELV
jgi:hypothetical protein